MLLEPEVEKYVALANRIFGELQRIKRGNVPDDLVQEALLASELAGSLKYEVSVIKELFPKDDQQKFIQMCSNVFAQRNRLTSAIVSRLQPKIDHDKYMECLRAMIAQQEN